MGGPEFWGPMGLIFPWEPLGWVMGWVSGINAAQKLNWSRAPSAEDIWDAILVYCVKNPQDDLRDAAETVYVEFLNKSI